MNLQQQSQGFSEDYWCPADTRASAASAPAPLIDGAVWIALLKMSNGDRIAPAEQDWLLAQKLIEIRDGVSSLTRRGRDALGI